MANGFLALPCREYGQRLASDSRNLSWTERVITEDELLNLEKSNPALDVNTCREILSRLNTKEAFYIRDDVRNSHKIKVPNDFGAYKGWTPLPVQLPASLRFDRFILVVKDIPFLGWYESGVLVSGQPSLHRELPRKIRRRDFTASKTRMPSTSPDPIPTSSGKPAWMPFSLRIYETVYIHAGNVFGARCSHGCVILPVERAETLFPLG